MKFTKLIINFEADFLHKTIETKFSSAQKRKKVSISSKLSFELDGRDDETSKSENFLFDTRKQFPLTES